MTAFVPEGFALTAIGEIVEGDEVADASPLDLRQAIEGFACRGLSPRSPGRTLSSRPSADWTRWMLVDSSGSMNPAASPSATQLCDQNISRAAAGEAERPGIGERRAVEIGKQDRRSLVVRHEARCNRRGRCRCDAAAGCAIAIRPARDIACV